MLQFPQLFAQQPAARDAIIESHDPYVVSNRFASEFAAHQLDVTGNSRRFRTVAHMVRLGEATLYRVSSSADIQISSNALHDRFAFYLPLNSNIRIERRDGPIEVSPGHIGIANPTEPYRLNKFNDCTLVVVKVSRQAIEHQANSLFGTVPDLPLMFDANKPASTQSCPLLLRLIDMIHADLSLSDNAMSNTACSEPTEALLMRLLLRELPNNHSVSAPETGSDTAASPCPVPFYVKRVEQLIANDARRPFSMNEFVDAAGVSARTLFAGFRQYRGTSPMRRLREVRLDHVRSELAAIGSGLSPQRTVTEVALDWGFNHMGDFSSAYRDRFGETPSQTLKPRA